MLLIISPQTKQAYASLFTEALSDLGRPSSGEVIPITTAIVDKITSPDSQRIWTPRVLTGGTMKAAIGRGFIAPVAGTFTITFGANTTADLDFNATGADVQTALNLLASVISAGGVTVAEAGGGFYIVTFNNAGARAQMTVDVDNLAPLSVAEVGTLVEGDGTMEEVQSLRVLQNPGAYATLADDALTPGVVVDELAAGSAGVNHKIRVTLDPSPYDGRFTLTVAGQETPLIGYNAEEADVQAALEGVSQSSGLLISGRRYTIVLFKAGDDFDNIGAASNATGVVFTASGTTPTTWTNGSVVSAVGAGNVTVSKEEPGIYLIVFSGALANFDMDTITGSGVGLKILPTFSGSLDMRTSAISLLLGAADSADAVLEIEWTPSGGEPEKILRQDITIVRSIINPGNMVPPPQSGPGYITTIPTSDSFAGVPGQIALSSEGLYYCYAPNAWRVIPGLLTIPLP